MQKRSGKVPVNLIVAATVVTVALIIASGPIERHMVGSRFPPAQLKKYEQLYSWELSKEEAEARTPCRTGKVVMVVPTRWSVYRLGNLYTTQLDEYSDPKKERVVDPPRLDDNFFQLPSSVRASSPEEVDTVILCTYAKHRVGTYVAEGNNAHVGGAYRRLVHLTLYNAKTGKCLGARTMHGKDPKQETTIMGSFTGEFPDVCRFVEELPLRQ